MSAAIRGSGPRNKFPDYVVQRLKVDKTGIFSGTCVRQFKVGPVNQRIDPMWLVNAPAPWSIPCVEAGAEIMKGLAVVTYHYDGTPNDNSFTFGEDQTEYELDVSLTEEPIETHPGFALLKKLYGWNDGKRRFSELMPGNADSSSTPFPGGTENKSKPNPLFGIDTWLAVGAVFKMTYARKTVPQDILRGIGTIIARPKSGNFQIPPISKRRNWLKMAPVLTKRGNAVQITEQAMLSGAQGWPVPIYRAGQLD